MEPCLNHYISTLIKIKKINTKYKQSKKKKRKKYILNIKLLCSSFFFSFISWPFSIEPSIELSSSCIVSFRHHLSAYFDFSGIVEDSIFKRDFALEANMMNILSKSRLKQAIFLLSSTTHAEVYMLIDFLVIN